MDERGEVLSLVPKTLLWGQLCYEDETGAASLRKHITLPVRWPLWETKALQQMIPDAHRTGRAMLILWDFS